MAERRKVCSFFLNGLRLGVDVQQVQEVVKNQEYTPIPQAPPAVRGLMNLRGQIVTGLDLRVRLKLHAPAPPQRQYNVVVRSRDNAVVSLLVDQVGDVVEVGPDAFEPTPETIADSLRPYLEGIYRLDSGLLLVLDLDSTLDLNSGK